MPDCERCGREMPENMTICPSCGTISSYARPNTAFTRDDGSNLPPSPNYTNYSQGYTPQPQPQSQPQPMYPPQGYAQQPQQIYIQQPQPVYPQQIYVVQPQPIYVAQPQPVYMAQPQSIINVGPSVIANTNTTPVIVEVLLSLFLGIYGVGWLMAGETTTGIILLVCSLVLYWPILIVSAILTVGTGLLCLGPLAIGALILNAVLLNNKLKRKAMQIIIMQQPR